MPTTNPVPSTDPSDLLFNAGKLDEVVNGTTNSFTDRLGVARRTVAGMNADFDAQLADAESDLNVYRADAAASAAEALGYLQTIRATSYGAYASDPATDPFGNPPTVGDEYFNTTSNLLKRWNGTTWQASDINTANLAATSGSSLIGYDGGTVQDVLDAVTGPNGAASVGYTPAGTGAVATTVQGKQRQIVSVKDFGAVGDGVTDDSAAFQKAINYARSSSIITVFPANSAVVHVPWTDKGYGIGSTVNCWGVHLQGDITLITPLSTNTLFAIEDPSYSNGTTKTRISGLSFVGSADPIYQKITKAIHVGTTAGAFNVVIDDNNFHNWQGNAILVERGESVVIEKNNFFNGREGNCILARGRLESGLFANNLTISQNRFNGMGGNATYAYAAVVVGGLSVNIIDNLFVACRGGAVWVSQYDVTMGCKVSGNYFENNGYNNKFHVALGNNSGSIYARGVEVSSNMMLGAGSSGLNTAYAIYVDKASAVNIFANMINNASGQYAVKAVYVEQSCLDISLTNNYFVLEQVNDAFGGYLNTTPGAKIQGSTTDGGRTFAQEYGVMRNVSVAGSASLQSTYTLYDNGIYEVSLFAYRADGHSKAVGTWIVNKQIATGNSVLKSSAIGAPSVVGDYTAVALSDPSGGGVVTATVTQSGTAYSSTFVWHVKMVTPLY